MDHIPFAPSKLSVFMLRKVSEVKHLIDKKIKIPDKIEAHRSDSGKIIFKKISLRHWVPQVTRKKLLSFISDTGKI